MNIQRLFIITLVIFLLLINCTNALADEWVLKFGSHANQNLLYSQAIVKISEWAEERSEGRLKIETFFGGQLGNERDAIESVKMGTFDMTLCGASSLGVWQNDFNILGMAFIWKDIDHLTKVVRGPIGQEMIDKLVKETGIKIIDMGWIFGERHFNTNTLIRTPDDIAGLKIRTPEVPIYVSNLKAMGATPVAMSSSETFVAIQTGVIDGQENAPDTIYANKMYEVTKYLCLSSHVIQNQAILINNRIFNKMPEDLQNILVEATIDAGEWNNQQVVENAERCIQLLKDEGMIVIDDVDRDAFREKSVPLILEEWGDTWAEGLYEKIKEAAD